jgi:hypothetical protein
MIRALVVPAVAALTLVVATPPDPMPLRADRSQAALASLGQEYGDLQLWVTAIAATTDTLAPSSSERAQVLAQQLARLIRPLEKVFEETTASLSTAQLETILPLWERMAFAHAGFVLLEEEAAALAGDPALQPEELQNLVAQLSAVLEFAADIQAMIMSELTQPIETPIRIT